MSINNHPLFVSIGPTESAARASVGAAGSGPSSGDVLVTGDTWTSGAHTAFIVKAAPNTAVTAGTETPDALFDFGRTVQWATGSLTNQRALKVKAPTYAFVGASTLTNAATVYIDAAPTAGTNATITNAYSLWVAAGLVKFDGGLSLTGTLRVSMTDSSGTPGAATINKVAGKVAIAASASSVTVTNSLVTASSIVLAQLQTIDGTLLYIKAVVPTSGAFTITGNATATGAVTVAFLVINP